MFQTIPASPTAMKSLVTGLVLIAVSGAALIWHLASRPAALPPPGLERTARCMVWKAERGKATVWLCGSFHLLRPEDYPLPAPYLKAFEDAKVLVTESGHNPADAGERRAKSLTAGQLPEGESLQQRITPAAWQALSNHAGNGGPALAQLQRMKPWQASFHLASHAMQHLGYSPARGLESYFTEKAGTRTLSGLETLDEQLARIDGLDAATQEAMLLRVLEEAKDAQTRAAVMVNAWREGDTRRLAADSAESMATTPALKKAIYDDRHAAWLPRLEAHLDGSDTVMVLVGTLHLCGPGSLIELLEAKGAKLTQMEYRTTRPLESP